MYRGTMKTFAMLRPMIFSYLTDDGCVHEKQRVPESE